MGRTIPSFRIASLLEEKEWKSFRNSLDKSDRDLIPTLSSTPSLITVLPPSSIAFLNISKMLSSLVHETYTRYTRIRSMDYLAEVEERIKHKIEQIEEEMDNTHERENTDRLMPKIETLNWVLNEILVLDKEG